MNRQKIISKLNETIKKVERITTTSNEFDCSKAYHAGIIAGMKYAIKILNKEN